MNNFTRLGKVLMLALCFTALAGSGLQAQQNCNLAPIVTINDFATDADPVVNVNFQNFFLDGEVIIRYEPLYGGIGFSGIFFETQPLEVISGFTSFVLAEPRLPGISTNNQVRITEIEFITPVCSQTFGVNEVVGTFDFTADSDVTFSPINVVEPACPGSASGSIQFSFSSSVPDGAGTNPATRFSLQVVPFTPSAIATLTPNTLTNSYAVSVAQLTEGDYTLVITDNQEGYSVTVSETLESGLDIVFSNVSDAGCFGESNGELSIDATGVNPAINGVLNYQVFASGNFTPVASGSIVPMFISNGFAYDVEPVGGLPAGNYQIFVTPAGQSGPGQQPCVLQGNVVIEEEDAITLAQIGAPTICADADQYVLSFGDFGGGDTSDFRFRVVDATLLDGVGGNNSDCFNGNDPNSYQRLDTLSGINGDGTFSYPVDFDNSCLNSLNRDTTVAVVLQFRNAVTGCTEEFDFTLQINAQPETPIASTSAMITGGSTVAEPFCSGEEFNIDVDNYDPAFDYEISLPTLPANVTTDAAFAGGGAVAYTGAGSVVTQLTNLNDGARTLEYVVTATNPATGCVSESFLLEAIVRPEPVITFPAGDLSVLRCSGQEYLIEPEVNDGNNANLTFNYELALPTGLTINPGFDLTGEDLESGDLLDPRFFNTTGGALTATLTITPTFVQNSQQTNGNGGVENNCFGEARTITITVSPEPTLNATANIGDNSISLTSGDVLSEEICTGEAFLIDNLSFTESVTGAQLAFVNVEVTGDASFLNISTPFEQDALADGFTLGSDGGVQNNTPDAQIVRIILTPYFELDANAPDFVPNCAGEPIEVILTLNPAPPTITSPQAFTVCSGERVMETIAGASGGIGGNNNTFETRISQTLIFDETTTEYVVPVGADRIENFDYILTGANGGSTDGSMGGLGATLAGTFNSAAAEILPGDTIRVRRATESTNAVNGAGAEGGDATTMVLIGGPNRANVVNQGKLLFALVAAGGGGAATGSGLDAEGGNVSLTVPTQVAPVPSSTDGDPGAAPGGDGGTGFPSANGGAGRNTGGGGGGGGYNGGDGGNSTNNTGGDAGENGVYAAGTFFAPDVTPTATQNAEDTDVNARLSFTVVYDDIRFTATGAPVLENGLTTGPDSENILDNAGETDTILFGQQLINNTDGPLTATYEFTTQTEANCPGTSTVTVVLTVEPEPTGFLATNASSTSMLAGDADAGYTTTICSGDGFNFDLNSDVVASGGRDNVYFTVSSDVDTGISFFGRNGTTANNLEAGNNFLPATAGTAIPFVENGVVNNSGDDLMIEYTIVPFIADGTDVCEGEAFTFTITVQAGFSGLSPVTADACSDVSLGDSGFELATSQPGATNDFENIRVMAFQTSTNSADFDTVASAVPAVIPAGGVLLTETGGYFDGDVFRNKTGGDVTVTYTVVFVSDQNCESLPVDYTFTIYPEPVIDEDTPGTEKVVCSDSDVDIQFMEILPANTISFIDEFEVTVAVAPGLVSNNSPAINDGDVLTGNADIIELHQWTNETTTSLDVEYTVIAISDDGCKSDPVVFTVTVEPVVVLGVVANDSMATNSFNDAPVITICSGGTVNFELTNPLTDGTNVSYRVSRDVSNAGDVRDGQGMVPDNFEGGLPVADFIDTLTNTGTAPQRVLYTLRGYTFGTNEMDGNGLTSTLTDCLGPNRRVIVEVLPENSAPGDLTVNYIDPSLPQNQQFLGNNVLTDTVCNNQPIGFDIGTPLATGNIGFRYLQDNDGGQDRDTVFGDFTGFVSGNNNFNRVTSSAANPTLGPITYTYTFQIYTYGPDGVDNQMAAGSDDCPGFVRTQTIYVLPTPELEADVVAGGFTGTISSDNEAYFYELCAGDDFSISNLMFTTADAAGQLKYVEFEVLANTDPDLLQSPAFLGLTPGTTRTPASAVLISQQNVSNTTNQPYTETIVLTPYYEDGDDLSTTDCAGPSITVEVLLNPQVNITSTAQSTTICSGEALDYDIMQGNNTIVSVTRESFDFGSGGDFVFPANAQGIANLRLLATSGNGGNSATTTGAVGTSLARNLNVARPGDTLRVSVGNAGNNGTTAGDGGEATVIYLIDGINRNTPGNIRRTIVVGGGGGAGNQQDGFNAVSVSGGNTTSANGMPGAGTTTGFGFGAPTFAGGMGSGFAGGGGGGWIGGDSGSNLASSAGQSGTSFGANPARFSRKSASDDADGSAMITFTLLSDDVVFTVTEIDLPDDPDFDSSNSPVAVGDTGLEDLLGGAQFVNNADTAHTVTYTLSTSTEADCPGNEITVDVVVEPNPTIELASNGTTLMGDAETGYTATICSGDSLSATLFSDVIPSVGASRVEARVISAVESNPADVSFTNTNNANASALTNFGGNNEVAVDDIPFYEGAINNVSDQAETVTYTIISLINNPSRPNCDGDTITLTVTVQPGFDPVDPAPTQFGLCSNVSLDDAGFDLDATQGLGQALNIGFDTLLIDSVRVVSPAVAPTAPNFETISSVYSGSPVRVTRSGGFFGGDVYRNRTGGPVEVAYYVRLESAAGCLSEQIVYNFRYTAEPVIDEMARLDTVVCNEEMIDLSVELATNSAWFGNPGNVDYDINRVLPAGLMDEVGNGTYPASGVAAAYFAGDAYENTTDEPLTVTYYVTPFNGTCVGDSVTFTATILPNPDAEVTLSSMDSTASFSLANSRAFLNPNPAFGLCSGQALDVDVTGMASAGTAGTLRAVVTITEIDGTTMTAGTPATFNIPASELADSLSFAAGELINLEAEADTVRVRYFTYFERNGTQGNQSSGAFPDCGSNGVVEFDILVNPVQTARLRLRDAANTFYADSTEICGGDEIDLIIDAAGTVAAIGAGPDIDSFQVVFVAAPLNTVGANTFDSTFFVDAGTGNRFGVNVFNQQFVNNTGMPQALSYYVTPFSNGCAGMNSDTLTLIVRPELEIEFNEQFICAAQNVPVELFVEEANGNAISSDPFDFSIRYLGGTAENFTIQATANSNSTFVDGNTAPFTLDDRSSVILTNRGVTGAPPLTAEFQLTYEDAVCGVTVVDTVTVTFAEDVSAGEQDNGFGVQCDGVNIVLFDAIIGEDPDGTFTFTNGDPGLGTLSGSNFLPNIGGNDATPVAIEFTYTVGGGVSSCAEATTDFTVLIEPAPNAGSYVGTPGEACQNAAIFNLYDLLDGETQGGVFTQTGEAGSTLVPVGADGLFDQSTATPGTYTYTYTVSSANGCDAAVVTGIQLEVLAQEDCSDPVPCDVIQLAAGFNVISFDVIPNNNDVRVIFADEIASRNLLRVVGIQPDANNGNPQSVNYLSILDDYVGDIDGGIQGGYGYIVQVENATTIEVCGTAVDPDLRVELQAGLNIVGYVPQTTEAVDSYFDDIIATGDLNLVRTVDNGIIQDRIYGVLPFPIGPLATMQNGFGYLVDVNVAFGEGTWRTNASLNTTSVFDQFYGFITGGDFAEGETIAFTDADGNEFGRTVIREGGLYYNAFAFGDLESTEETTEGFAPEGKIYVRFRDQLIATGAFFEGAWANRRLDVDLGEFTSPVSDLGGSASAIQVFPNPTEGMTTLIVDLDRAEATARLEVVNGLGQVVVSRQLNQLAAGEQQLDLDLTYLAAGTYRVRVYTAERMIGLQQVIRR